MTRIGSLFTGYGGLDLAVRAAVGGSVVWHSEWEPPTRKVPKPAQAAARILAHHYPEIPNLGDITAIDWSTVEPVDVLTGGFPCQDVSQGGLRAGLHPDSRSGLWTHMAYAIDQLRPGLVVIENVRGLLNAPAHGVMEPCDWCVGDGEGFPLRALGAVLGDLADIGYDASWQGLSASDVGAPHGRFRVFILAWPARHPSSLHPEGADRLAGGSRRTGSPPRGSDRGTPPDPGGDGRERSSKAHHPAGGHESGDVPDGRAPAHPEDERQQGGRRPRVGGAQPADRRGPVPDPDDRSVLEERSRPRSRVGGARAVQWGEYEPAVRRWERLTRPAPAPTVPGHKGTGRRLSPAFVEWMMGLPEGWVTGVPGLRHGAKLKALGNGVVPQQAAEAIRLLLPDVPS